MVEQPHNIVRHEDTPKAIFKLLWSNLQAGKIIYVFIKNKTKDGGYYWSKAFVSPIVKNGRVEKYVAYRTLIEDEDSIRGLINFYRMLCDYERGRPADDGLKYMNSYFEDRNLTYGHLLVRLTQGKQITNASSLHINVGSYFDDHVIFRTHIVRQVDLKIKNIEVTKPCCCRFGKWLKEIQGEDYTRHKDWRNIITAHDAVHNKLQQYVHEAQSGSNEGQLQSLLGSIEDDTHTIFDSLQHVIDEYEE